MTTTRNDIMIRNGKFEDLESLQQLFAETIRTVCHKDYTANQIAAWAAGSENKERWQKDYA